MRGSRVLGTAAVVIAASVMAVSMIASRLGGSAAAEEAITKAPDLKPISLAGRWTGQYYGFGHSGEDTDCSDSGCKLTYDIVACKEGWCGISVQADNSCGAKALHLSANPQQDGGPMFQGRLEIAKGAAPYAVGTWPSVDKDTGAVSLHLIGNTGAELLLFRRSYPFDATLTRSGDAVCTLDKTTS